MDTSETSENTAMRTDVDRNPARRRTSLSRSDAAVSPQACASCQASGDGNPDDQNTAPAYVYALGRVEARFPRVSVEKEFAQVAGRADYKGNTEREMLQTVLAQRENRYLVRQLCWVMTIQGMDAYLLHPRD